jgi:hypothetical protein
MLARRMLGLLAVVVRRRSEWTFVLVFMYTYNSGHENTITAMLESFKVK